jgi:Concanavalin A-like lectin/glucanases superfamily
VLADSSAGYWRLGESSGILAAASAGSVSGSYQGGVTLGLPGALAGDANTAAGFDGSDDKVSMGDPASGALDFGTGDFTLEAWAKTTVNGERAILSKRASGPYYQFTVTDDPGHTGEVRANVLAGATNREVYGPAVRVDNGAWHHVVVVFDRDVGVTVYVDGVGRLTAGAFPDTVDNTGPFLVGKSTGYGYHNGQIDEVAVYASALPAARVLAHYNAGSQ